MDWERLRAFMAHAAEETGGRRSAMWAGMIRDSLTYNISLLEYFQFGFHRGATAEEKSKWAGTGTMYEYHKRMNPPGAREILDDKTRFKSDYAPFMRHQSLGLDELRAGGEAVKALFDSPKLVLKQARGKCGRGMAFVRTDTLTPEGLCERMEREGYGLAEAFVEQHPELDRLSPSGVNTVRIVTQLDERGQVEILGCRQRISVDSPVDNLAAGNIAAPIDERTGVITGPAVYSDIFKENVTVHPVTGVPIVGFQVPMWAECMDLATRAALHRPQNRSIGWDIVVTAQGPGLIEGNHDWCKLLWQLPVRRGLRETLAS